MKLRIAFLGAVSGLLGLGTAHAASDGLRPNIVFIVADDLGHRDLASYGHPYARTPSIDRLAAEGTRFEQVYATGKTCRASRIGFMTGKFPATFREDYSRFGPGSRLTVTELLKRNGYSTGHFGKWHLSRSAEPGSYGIDKIVAVRQGYRKAEAPPEHGRDAKTFDRAIKFIERNRDRPFYVNVWTNIAHFPFNPPPRHLAAFRDLVVSRGDFSEPMRSKFDLCVSKGCDLDEAMRKYLGSVRSLDEDVGRLLAKLDELNLRDNTIVVFSSDQGPAQTERPERATVKRIAATRGADESQRVEMMGYVGDLRGGKHSNYEGGVRIPFIVRWPSKVPAGRLDTTSVISGADWLPTLAAVTGAELETGDLDGEDVSDAWLGRAFTRSKPLFWSTRSRTAPTAMRKGRWKLHLPGHLGGAVELYDLGTDSGERHNLAEKRPEVVVELTRAIETWRKTLPEEYERSPRRQARYVYYQGLVHQDRARELEEEAAHAYGQADEAYGEAVKRYQRAVDLWPKLHPAWGGLCELLSREGLYRESLDACDRALAIEPRDRKALEYRGLAYLKLGRLEEARRAHEELTHLGRRGAARLLKAMQRWIEERREAPEELPEKLVEEFATWVEELGASASGVETTE